ncbi:hypothetical protein [Bifidobacterium xylocopae]|uniref:Mobile element protein n=1 Tax=Bifidobacterium xylocopae TaxID=2493119 RepID=A0A366KEE2_9BIFI|nr:hypothetical protein [Bifidobacterium xylocopae]RBQ00065.1 hypothetical protein CRD59_00965 [Bifidobacterium xylocopae]
MSELTETRTLAAAEDLAMRIGCKADDGKLLLSLRLASDRFAGQSHNPIAKVEHEEIVLDATGTRSVRLPLWPVLAVDRVLLSGTLVDFEWSADGMLRFERPLPDRWRALMVTYSHGYDPIPGDVSDAVLEQAAAIYQVLPGLASYTTGAESRTYSLALSVGTSAAWSAAVDKYRIGLAS